jgi:FixJ family two-component response regulator
LQTSPRVVAVVDDDPSMLRSVERLLNANGFPTACHPSAETFLAHADLKSLGCMVFDIQLGGMSGVELWQHLRRRGIDLPVIFITALEDDTLERAVVEAGCIAYLRKPFPAISLMAAVNSALVPFPRD